MKLKIIKNIILGLPILATPLLADSCRKPSSKNLTPIKPSKPSPKIRPFGFFAPFQDIGLADKKSFLGPINKATEQNSFVLAFLNKSTANGTLEFAGNSWDNDFIKDHLNGVSNPKFVVSTGGANGPFTWQIDKNATSLGNEYYSSLKAHGIHYFDYDIEGRGITDANIAASSAAQVLMDAQKDKYSLSIMLTLATLPTGLTSDTIKPLQAFVTAGVFPTVNIMSFNYGQAFAEPEGQYAIEALNKVHGQYKNILSKAGQTWSDAKIWGHQGDTNMIGVNNTFEKSNPDSNIFKLSDATQVLNFAEKNQLGFLSFWEASRDHQGTLNEVSPLFSGIKQADYAFINIFKSFK